MNVNLVDKAGINVRMLRTKNSPFYIQDLKLTSFKILTQYFARPHVTVACTKPLAQEHNLERKMVLVNKYKNKKDLSTSHFSLQKEYRAPLKTLNTNLRASSKMRTKKIRIETSNEYRNGIRAKSSIHP